MDLGHGIDIVSVSRIQAAIEASGQPFIDRVFHPSETAYCSPRKMKYEHYAARFAAKEAFIKALKAWDKGTGQVNLSDIEVRKEKTGRPYIHLSGQVLEKLALPPGTQIELSLAHEREYAVASVVIIIP